MSPLGYGTVSLTIGGVGLEVATQTRKGPKSPILFLHGFGSTKEDYADIALQTGLDGHQVLAYDAPGCGETMCSDLSAASIPFLVDTAEGMLRRAGIETFHLVGHSMGGLTALILADKMPDRVLSLCSIEGNLAPEDCFLSRQIHDFPAEDPEAFLSAFITRARTASAWSSPLFAASLRHKVRAEAVRGIFTSMVDLSDNANLMQRFLALPCPKMFMYGDRNRGLSYLAELQDHGVEPAEIPDCGHFPMYANPPEMWRRLTDFIRRAAP